MNKYYEALNYLNEIALGDNEFTEDIEVKEEMEKRRDLAYTTLKELLDNHKGGVKFEDIRRVGELRAQHEKVTAAAKRKAQTTEQSTSNMATKVEPEANDEDLDYWPDDWEDTDE